MEEPVTCNLWPEETAAEITGEFTLNHGWMHLSLEVKNIIFFKFINNYLKIMIYYDINKID
jgi:hypothetical protein